MEALLTYDIDTGTREGERTLRNVAKICEGYGERVQKSVFELVLAKTQYLALVAELDSAIRSIDSIRIYRMNSGSLGRAKVLGANNHAPPGEGWIL